jgi:hypothetical protein
LNPSSNSYKVPTSKQVTINMYLSFNCKFLCIKKKKSNYTNEVSKCDPLLSCHLYILI